MIAPNIAVIVKYKLHVAVRDERMEVLSNNAVTTFKLEYHIILNSFRGHFDHDSILPYLKKNQIKTLSICRSRKYKTGIFSFLKAVLLC